MRLTDSYKPRDLKPGVILTKFLLGNFQPRDSYKKNSYKKETVYQMMLVTRRVQSVNFH